MQTYHSVEPKLEQRFKTEHAVLCERLKKIAKENPDDEHLPRLVRFFAKTKAALQKHRYRVAEWKNRLEKIQLLYTKLPEVKKIILSLMRLLSEILTATKRQN